MDPGRALASLRALKSQPIPLARTAVEPRPVVEKRRSPHAARLQQKRANSGVLCPPLPPDELVSPRSLSLPRAQLLLDASDATAFATTAPTKTAEPAPPTGLAALKRKLADGHLLSEAELLAIEAVQHLADGHLLSAAETRALSAFEQTDGAAPAAAAAASSADDPPSPSRRACKKEVPVGGLNMAFAFDMEAGAVARRRVSNCASRPVRARRIFCGAARAAELSS